MSNNNQYGCMPMSQGAATYKAISTQTEYFMELMKQKEEAAISYAQSYGDVKNGIVAQFLSASESSASDEGKSIQQDAITSLVSAGIGTLGMVATVGMHFKTSTTDVDAQLDDAKAMKADLDAPPKQSIVLEDGNEEALGEPDQKIADKINSWSKGDKNLDNYQAKLEKLKGQDRLDAEESNNLNKRAVEHAKQPQTREKITKKLDDKIEDLNRQKSKLESQFTNTVQMVNMFREPLTSGITTPFTFKKAEATTEAKTEAAQAQVQSSVQQKQSSFIDTAQQEAVAFLQAADSAAASLGQIVQVHG